MFRGFDIRLESDGFLETRSQVKSNRVSESERISRVTQYFSRVNDWLRQDLVVSFLISANSLWARSAASSFHSRLFFECPSDSSWTINFNHLNSWNRAFTIVHSLSKAFLRRKKDITLISLERSHLWRSHGRRVRCTVRPQAWAASGAIAISLSAHHRHYRSGSHRWPLDADK
jgi:hypothetical protein